MVHIKNRLIAAASCAENLLKALLNCNINLHFFDKYHSLDTETVWLGTSVAIILSGNPLNITDELCSQTAYLHRIVIFTVNQSQGTIFVIQIPNQH